MKGYFVTGTGTGVGKTYVTATLARVARSAGQRVFAFKPIETGCTWNGSVLVGADQTILVDAAGGWQTGLLRGVYQFEPPVAPSVASQAIDLSLIDQTLRQGSSGADLVLVEGAGGWRVPITRSADMGTLGRTCGLPVIVVGTATLGTINHTLLTVEAVERDGLNVAAVVLSRLPTDSPEAAESNRDEISARWPGHVVILSGTNTAVLTVLISMG